MNERPSWDEIFIEECELHSRRSTCLSRKVGAVAVKEHRVLATGYNGAPPGVEHCRECLRRKLGVPSGERHEICLEGNTVIKLLDGTYKTIKELSEKKEDFWVYSIDLKTGSIVPALATNPRKTKTVNEITEITLDNNYLIKCTHDHEILLRSGCYKKASDLKIGDSLMPMYYNFSYNNGYESISNTIKARCEKWGDCYIGSTYTIPTHRLVYKHLLGEIKEDEVIHHKNEVITCNTPENLECIKKNHHSSIHSQSRSADFYKKFSAAGVKKQKILIENDPSFLQNMRENGRRNMKANWSNDEFVEKNKETSKITAMKMAEKYNSNKECIKNRCIGKIIKGINELSSRSGVILTSENYEETRLKHPISKKKKECGNVAPKIKNILKYFDNIETAIDIAMKNNHRVLSVKKTYVEDTDVFDISVPEYENFAIYTGDNSCIFVHNCRGLHAEQNLIIQAAYFGASLKNSTIYCNTAPCNICMKMLVSIKPERIVYKSHYSDNYADDVARKSGFVLIINEKTGF